MRRRLTYPVHCSSTTRRCRAQCLTAQSCESLHVTESIQTCASSEAHRSLVADNERRIIEPIRPATPAHDQRSGRGRDDTLRWLRAKSQSFSRANEEPQAHCCRSAHLSRAAHSGRLSARLRFIAELNPESGKRYRDFRQRQPGRGTHLSPHDRAPRSVTTSGSSGRGGAERLPGGVRRVVRKMREIPVGDCTSEQV